MEKLLSIVIPTKNRQFYCLSAVKQIISLKFDNVEIIIQDNSDNDSLRIKINNLGCNYINYNYHPGELSFVDNFSEPLNLVRGEYVCMIGDDDGVLPNIVEEVKKAKDLQIDAIIPGLNSVYFWPSGSPIIKGGESGFLNLIDVKKKFEYVDVLKGLSDLTRTGGQQYQKLNLARLYHGVVRMNCLNRILEKTGKYFDGLTPDIYMAVALSFVCNKVLRLYYPITISGICPRSGSAASATGAHTGELKDAPHFKGHTSYKWDDKAPKIYSVESIWAETVLHALRAFDAGFYYDKFKVDVLDGICLSKYPQFSEVIVDHAKKYGYNKFRLSLLNRFLYCHSFINRVIRAIFRKRRDKMKFYNIENIEQAVKIISTELSNRS